jgi:hypothetical protein
MFLIVLRRNQSAMDYNKHYMETNIIIHLRT